MVLFLINCSLVLFLFCFTVSVQSLYFNEKVVYKTTKTFDHLILVNVCSVEQTFLRRLTLRRMYGRTERGLRPPPWTRYTLFDQGVLSLGEVVSKGQDGVPFRKTDSLSHRFVSSIFTFTRV